MKSNEKIIRRKPKWERYNPDKKEPKSSLFSKKISAKKTNNVKAIRKSVTQKPKEKTRFWDLLFDFRFGHDKVLFYLFAGLIFIGIISVYSSSLIFAYEIKQNQFYYLINHLKFITIGLFALGICYFIKLEIIAKLWFIPLFISIALLVYLLVLSFLGKAEVVNGVSRWIYIGGFSFQPSDFAKLAFVIFVATFLSTRKTHYKDFREYLKLNLVPYSFWLFFILLLILVGNSNLGTAMVLGLIGVTTYAVSAVTRYHKIGLSIILGIMVLGGALFALTASYRMDRVAVWVNYWKTNNSVMADEDCPNRVGCYEQFDKSLTALGTGGLTGLGLGRSISKYYFFQTTAGDDSIIGIMGEEYGFILTTAIILLYLYLVVRCINIANRYVDQPIYFYMMIGCASWIGYQAFINIAANVGIIPLTGQTLPFISIGGSSLITLMAGAGIILNVSKDRRSAVSSLKRVAVKY